jgi:hypothetical protein
VELPDALDSMCHVISFSLAGIHAEELHLAYLYESARARQSECAWAFRFFLGTLEP